MKMNDENMKRRYNHMRVYCAVGGEVIKEGDKAYLIRHYDEELGKTKYMIVCPECYARLGLKNGKEIIFGQKNKRNEK